MKKRSLILGWFLIIISSCTRSPIRVNSDKDTVEAIKDTIAHKADALSIPDTLILTESPQFFVEELRTFINKPQDDLFPDHRDQVGYVLLQPQSFTGGDVPFLCYASDNITELYVDGKKIVLIKQREFFFRQKIKLYAGFNRIPIKIVNKVGEVTETYLDMTMESKIIGN